LKRGWDRELRSFKKLAVLGVLCALIEYVQAIDSDKDGEFSHLQCRQQQECVRRYVCILIKKYDSHGNAESTHHAKLCNEIQKSLRRFARVLQSPLHHVGERKC
jgi:hypothetical protein